MRDSERYRVLVDWAAEDARMIVRWTRHWLHYGLLAHTLVCVLVAALKGLLA